MFTDDTNVNACMMTCPYQDECPFGMSKRSCVALILLLVWKQGGYRIASQSSSNPSCPAHKSRTDRNMQSASSKRSTNRAWAYADDLRTHVCKHLTFWHVVTTCIHVDACRAIMQWITSMGRKLLTGSINLINTPFPGEFERVESTCQC